jgi:hypothetical protein
MPKLLDPTEWNDRFYCMAVLDDGSRVELKSETGKDFEALLVRYNDLALLPVVDTRQQELDSYAVQQWPTLAKAAAIKTPMKDEKSIVEWVDKVSLVSAEVKIG